MVHLSFRISAAALLGASLAVPLAFAGCGGGVSSTTLPTVEPAGPSQSFAAGRAASVGRDSVANQNAYSRTVLADDPIVYYPLADTSATLTDAGPNGLSGTYGSDVVRGAPTITAGPTSAAQFPGGTAYDPNGYAAVAPHAILQVPHVTLEAWFSLSGPNQTAHDIPLVVYGTLNHFVRYGLYIHGLGSGHQCLLYQQHNAGTSSLTKWSSVHLIVGQIYHVVAVSDGTNVSIYVNGVLNETVAFAGSIDYSQRLANGLQIGGADQSSHNADASFPGSIAQVAVYGTALSAARVAAHYLSGQLVPMVTEMPTSSDAFVDSIGVNAHFENTHLPYVQNFEQVHSLLVGLGIRHLREALMVNRPAYDKLMTELAADGIRASYITSLSQTESDISGFAGLVGSSLEQFEAPNEQDESGNADWVSQCQAFQKNLYGWIKGDSNLARFPVLGPALTRTSSFTAVGDLSQYLDDGNIHDYFSLFNPGTGGWGGTYPPYGVYGSIPFNMNLGRVVSGSKPIMSTETGYGSTPSGSGTLLDYRTHLRYMTRLFFEQFNEGIVRTYSYEFLDEAAGGVFGSNGLVQTDLTPKPAYYGLQSIIAALNDPGAAVTPTALTYKITGFVNGVDHTLLQKRDGTYVMAIWLEAPSWVTTGGVGGDILVPPQTVSLTTAKGFNHETLSVMDESGRMSTSVLTTTNSESTFAVTDKISLVTLK